jgi:hypothetical protein
VAVIRSRKTKISTAKKKTTKFCGPCDQAWRCREEDVNASIESLPMYLSFTGSDDDGEAAAPTEGGALSLTAVASKAIAAAEWQRHQEVLVVILGSFSAFHGGDFFARQLRYAAKIQRVWGHCPGVLVPFLLGMSTPERKAGREVDEWTGSFTQSTPAATYGFPWLPGEVGPHRVTVAKDVESVGIIVRSYGRWRALQIMVGSWLESIQFFNMLCAPKRYARPDARCRRVLLALGLQGRTIPKEFQTRMRVMLKLAHMSSLSYNNGGRHRCISNWANTLLSLMVATGLGKDISADNLLAPTPSPTPITKASPKAFQQVLDTMTGGWMQAAEKWQSQFQSPLKTVPKIKPSPLNLQQIKGGGGD